MVGRGKVKSEGGLVTTGREVVREESDWEGWAAGGGEGETGGCARVTKGSRER